MDIEDFKGLTKYKVLLPLIYIWSWISMFAGPSFFPVQYQNYSIFFIIYFILKITLICANTFAVNIKTWKLFNRIGYDSSNPVYSGFMNNDEHPYYCFIVPNYKQQIQLLTQTLDILASHQRAKESYLIILAMEAHETDSHLKAQQLIHNFKDSFNLITSTQHELRTNQQKGKASNVCWAAQKLQPILTQNLINPDSVFITILDADSWAPDLYIDQIEEHIRENYEERFTYIYQPPQIFTRNYLDVPVTTRVSDMAHSAAHLGYLYSFFDFHFPLSNYTLSYNLIKKIGFWDTCEDAIGEDMHTTLKAYWKTRGQIKSVPIYTPFNQVNISTGNGYWDDVKAKFWQVERHGEAVSDVAYCLKKLFNEPFRIKNLYVFYMVIETFIIIAALPWIIISLYYQYFLLYEYEKPSPQILQFTAINYLFVFLSIVGFISYINYQMIKRRTNKILYHQENESLLRMVEYLLLSVLMMIFMSGIAFIISSFSCLFGNREYVVAEKRSTKKIQPTQ